MALEFPDECQIVPATTAMLPEILQLEEACFSAPWTRKMLEAELTGNQFARFLVATVHKETEPSVGTIVGYHCFWIVFEELRLMNLAVHESMRGRGIGRALATEAVGMGLAHAVSRAVLEVRASNEPAQRLYRQLGFVSISTRRSYYTNPVEDALLMAMDPLVMPASSPHTRVITEGDGIGSSRLT
jgi:[ribosomal protein S18]-alanine N-acetyltransferase